MEIARSLKIGLALVALFGAAGVANASSTSKSSVIISSTGTYPLLGLGQLGTFQASGTSTFDDFWTFSIGAPQLLEGGVGINVTSSFNITSMAVKVFSVSTSTLVFSQFGPGTFTLTSVPVGDYYIEVSGTYTGTNGGSYHGDVTNNVPLPAAAWLLLSGVAGLGAMARRRKDPAET